jgi:hypothetical protein
MIKDFLKDVVYAGVEVGSCINVKDLTVLPAYKFGGGFIMAMINLPCGSREMASKFMLEVLVKKGERE